MSTVKAKKVVKKNFKGKSAIKISLTGVKCSKLKTDKLAYRTMFKKYKAYIQKEFPKTAEEKISGDFDKFVNSPDIEAIDINKNLILYTNKILCNFTNDGAVSIPNGVYDMGKYKIIMNNRVEFIEMFNRAGPVKHCGYHVDHPHIYNCQSGRAIPCWDNNIEYTLGTLLGSNHLFMAACICIKFLKSCHYGGVASALELFPKVG